tara:strand:- start:456 stop:761 length:306 start_codon:yes stop_codon:yes gene_type:complete
MIVYVDIDETICKTPDDRNYANSVPIKKNIKKINKMYDNGDEIVYWTARGTVTGIDWTEITKKQLIDWGAKHHDVKLGKPHFDLYICDKSFNVDRFFGDNE